MEPLTISRLNKVQISEKGIEQWPVWEKEISRFNWEYREEEQCFILEGEAIVETSEGNYVIRQGDFVRFRQGLKCVWDIKQPIRKHYIFK